jgi:hypothetical protein
MSSRDIITGKWESRLFSRNNIDYVTSHVKFKGLKAVKDTQRASSIWGDLENIRKTREGRYEADYYEGNKRTAVLTLNRGIEPYGSYGDYLDGTISLDLNKTIATMWDRDISKNWIAKIDYL